MNQELYSAPWSFGSVAPPYSDWDQARVAVLSVPYDSTTDWRAGAREGPHAIIEASLFFEKYDIELDAEIHKVGIHTLPDLKPQTANPEAMISSVYLATKDILSAGKTLLMLGGEHSITLGAIRAYHEKYADLSVLQLDAHADLYDTFKGSRFSHATVMRRVQELCPIVQVGVRSLGLEEAEYIKCCSLRPFYADGLTLNDETVDTIVSSLSDTVYVTFDLDVLDPSIMSATGTPEPGGLDWNGTLRLLRAVARARKVVGFDVVELSPHAGPVSCAYLAAKLAYKMIGYTFLTKK